MKMTTDIPPEITTPDSVKTRIGTLKFFDGFPDDATTQKAYDNIDFQRGVEPILAAMPGASVYALREGFKSQGADNQTVLIMETLMDSKSLFSHGERKNEVALRLEPLVLTLDPSLLRGQADDRIVNAPNSPKMERMEILPRIMEPPIRQALQRQKSVLLLGPRQTGKTTLLKPLKPDLLLNFLRPEVRQRYERAPHLLGAEVEALGERTRGGRALIALDEVQRVPELVNVVQDLIDRKVARFILTGSSARKLRRGGGVNCCRSRLVPLRLDPLSLAERVPPTIEGAWCMAACRVSRWPATTRRAKRTCAPTRRFT